MKLELKHLAPYLTYGLNLVNNVNRKRELTIAYLNYWNESTIEIKPILRPLSDFNTGIAKDIMKDLDCSYIVVSDIWSLEDGSLNLKDVRLETYEAMCKNYIDFNKLIEKGLAIDINTLE
jgi:hypothetical protein